MRGIENVNVPCKNNVLELAFKKSGIKSATKKARWPRVKGPSAVRIDCGSGLPVSMVSNMLYNKESV